MSDVLPGTHLCLASILTVAFGLPDEYHARYGHVMQEPLDIDRELRNKDLKYSEEIHNRNMYRYGLWEVKK